MAISAQLKVFSMKGQEVYRKELIGKGQGEVQLSRSTFAAGTYIYHLVVDGQSVISLNGNMVLVRTDSC